MNAPYITNIKEADPGIKVLCPNHQFLTSTHTADLTYPNLPPSAKSSHLFRQLAFGSLLSIGQLCDTDWQAYFDASRMIILYNNEIVLTGTRTKGGLWYVDPPDSTDYSDISLKSF